MSIPTDQAIAIAHSHHRAGRLADAEAIYRQVLSRHPAHGPALDSLGVLLLQTGKIPAAEALFRRAVAADPNHANFSCNLGESLRRQGRFKEAVITYRQAIALKPDLAVAHNNLGIALAEACLTEEAIDAYQTAIQINPDYADAYSNLANAFNELKQIDDAIAAASQAVALNPNSATYHNTLGVALAAGGQFSRAIEAYRIALRLHPRYADACSNLGNSLAQIGAHEAAMVASRLAVEMDPQLVQSHWNYAVILLRGGDLLDGWREYEWRWKAQTHFPRPSPRYHPPRFGTPHWTGNDIAGQTIFLHAEQGFGDAIHFARYAPLVAARGAKVVLEVHGELHRILRHLPGVDQVIARGDLIPPFDHHCPLMSLPLALGTTLETIPANIPYVVPEPALLKQWAQILGPRDGRLRVGLSWAGSPKHSDDNDRSMALSEFAPLASPRVQFHTLQKGPAAEQAVHPPAGLDLIDHSPRLGDFADTAALIAHLDLVITVDTAVAHLAGAMGKPVWTLIRYVPDWRWRLDRSDTPWYPSMRLFRQSTRGDWAQVVRNVAGALAELQTMC